jgi:hypothetical protein
MEFEATAFRRGAFFHGHSQRDKGGEEFDKIPTKSPILKKTPVGKVVSPLGTAAGPVEMSSSLIQPPFHIITMRENIVPRMRFVVRLMRENSIEQ